MLYALSNVCVMSKKVAELYFFSRKIRLSVVLFDESVLLWSAFAGNQIGGWASVCLFRLLGGALLTGAFQIF
jgi:hypothetical protein